MTEPGGFVAGPWNTDLPWTSGCHPRGTLATFAVERISRYAGGPLDGAIAQLVRAHP